MAGLNSQKKNAGPADICCNGRQIQKDISATEANISRTFDHDLLGRPVTNPR